MNNKQQLVKKNPSIICLAENALKQVYGGIGSEEKKIIEAVGTIAGVLVCGPACAVVGHKVGSVIAEVAKIFPKKKKKRWHF
jgi:hypothetical protein